MDKMRKELAAVPMLFWYDPERFGERLRQMIKDEIAILQNSIAEANTHVQKSEETKPLYRIEDLCYMFIIIRLTIYAWIENEV